MEINKEKKKNEKLRKYNQLGFKMREKRNKFQAEIIPEMSRRRRGTSGSVNCQNPKSQEGSNQSLINNMNYTHEERNNLENCQNSDCYIK